MERVVRNMGLKLKIVVSPGDGNLGVLGSLIIIIEALGRMRFFSVKMLRRKEGL